MKVPSSDEQLSIIGWREKLALPQLGIKDIKAKIDTGARSSALHAFDIEIIKRGAKEIVRFSVHPYQGDNRHTVTAEAELLDMLQVRNSGGQSQIRPVIQTIVESPNSGPEERITAIRATKAMGLRLVPSP
jgi:hypothetical protein